MKMMIKQWLLLCIPAAILTRILVVVASKTTGGINEFFWGMWIMWSVPFSLFGAEVAKPTPAHSTMELAGLVTGGLALVIIAALAIHGWWDMFFGDEKTKSTR